MSSKNIVNFFLLINRITSSDIMRDKRLNIQPKKIVMKYLVTWPGRHILNQIINIRIRYKRLMTKESYRSGVYMSCYYKKIQEIE